MKARVEIDKTRTGWGQGQPSGGVLVSCQAIGGTRFREKRQRAAAVQDAGATGDGLRQREAFGTAAARWSFCPGHAAGTNVRLNRHFLGSHASVSTAFTFRTPLFYGL
jgi:hypothetical protein